MQPELCTLIKELTELSGLVGQEEIVLDRVEALWTKGGAQVTCTRIGNVLGRVRWEGRVSGPKILLAAHADELCYIVRAIDRDGLSGLQTTDRHGCARIAFTTPLRWDNE